MAQVHAFLITMQENAEGTLKKGILRLAGTALGGAVALPIGVLTPGWQIPALALLEAAICWTVPAPPLTRLPANPT